MTKSSKRQSDGQRHAPGARLMSAAELVDMTVLPPRLLTDGVLPIAAEQRVMLHAREGEGKTMLVLDAAVGAAALGHRSLLMLGEGSHWALKNRLQRLAAGRDLDLTDIGQHIQIHRGPLPLGREGVEELIALTEASDPTFVVLDPLVSFIEGSDVETGDMTKFVREMDEWLAHGISVVVTHHDSRTRGSPDYRGSGVLAGWADSRYQLGHDREGRWLQHHKERDGESGAKKRLEIEFDEHAIQVRERGPDGQLRGAGDSVEQRVIEALEDGPRTKTGIREAAGLSGDRCNKAIKTLLARHAIEPCSFKGTDASGRMRPYDGYQRIDSRTDTRTGESGCPAVRSSARNDGVNTAGHEGSADEQQTAGHTAAP